MAPSRTSSPSHTEALLSAVPVPDPAVQSKRIILQGELPSPVNAPSGCHFHTRCPYAEARCKVEAPRLREVKPGQFAASHLREGRIDRRERMRPKGSVLAPPLPRPREQAATSRWQ